MNNQPPNGPINNLPGLPSAIPNQKKGLAAFWARGIGSKLILVFGGLVVGCCGLSVIGALLTPRGQTPTTVATIEPGSVVAVVTAVSQSAPTARPLPTLVSTLAIAAPTATPRPAPTATLAPIGFSRNLPATVGASVETGDYTYTLVGIERPADKTFLAGNQFNSKAEAGNEMILITLATRCNKQGENKCSMSLFDISVAADDGIVRNAELSISGMPNMLSTTQFLAGATLTGRIGFEVPKGKPVVMEIRGGLNSKAIFWRLP